MLLKGKVAIITGAAQGLGKAYALGFAKEGAKVMVVDIQGEKAADVAKEIQEQGGEAAAISTDVADEKSTQEMAKETEAKFGKIDILLNNAAIYYGVGMRPWTAMTVEEWDKIFDVNVKGSWLCCKAVAPYMIAKGKGKIINVGSGTVFAGTPFMLHYVATKGAILSLTRSLASELGEHGINVNCVAPGFTMSEASLEMPFMPPGLADMIASIQCFKRSEQPEDVVGTAIYLASELSDFVTGQTILVDGGMGRH